MSKIAVLVISKRDRDEEPKYVESVLVKYICRCIKGNFSLKTLIAQEEFLRIAVSKSSDDSFAAKLSKAKTTIVSKQNEVSEEDRSLRCCYCCLNMPRNADNRRQVYR